MGFGIFLMSSDFICKMEIISLITYRFTYICTYTFCLVSVVWMRDFPPADFKDNPLPVPQISSDLRILPLFPLVLKNYR